MTEIDSAIDAGTEDGTGQSMDVEDWISQLKNKKTLSEKQLKSLCRMVQTILKKEDNVVLVSSPVTVCGDLHGQIHELLEVFNIAGEVPDVNYLFMGDYVDRGFHSVVVISLLMSLKCRYPNRVTLLRGNHESRMTTQVYGFYDECLTTYGNCDVWKLFMDTFDCLPLCALVDERVLCMHGGLSPSIATVDEIAAVNRFQEVPEDGAMCDLLWSDPEDWLQLKGWSPNSRGVGYTWAEDVTNDFLHDNQLEVISRAHQVVAKGCNWCHHEQVVTVFTAANYCYRSGNLGGYMTIGNNTKTCHSFEACPRGSGISVTQNSRGYFF